MRYLVGVTLLAVLLLRPLGASAAPHNAPEAGSTARLVQICTEAGRDITGLPIDQYQHSLQLDGDKRAALDELASDTMKAAQDLKAACPTDTPLTATGRLAAMQARIEAMIAAVATVRPPLEKFYGLLSDEQKEQINTLGQSRRPSRTGLLDQDCNAAEPGMAEWPTADIERTVHPTEAQRASLTTVQEAVGKAAELSKSSCPTESLITPTARLAAVAKRLDALLAAAKTVSAPLNDFYAMLDDEQKARFDTISLSRASQSEPSKAKPSGAPHHRRYVSFGYLIRRFFHLY